MHRIGKTNQPSFKIVVVDKRKSAAAGSFLEEVGQINRAVKSLNLNKERAAYWLKQGAMPSPSVHNIFIDQKLIEGKKIASHSKPKKSDKKGEAPVAAKAPEAAVKTAA
jgi:small subunit ribosomal protein S16